MPSLSESRNDDYNFRVNQHHKNRIGYRHHYKPGVGCNVELNPHHDSTASNAGRKGWNWRLRHYWRLGAASWVLPMAAREGNLVLPSAITMVRLHASSLVRVCPQWSVNSYDESAGAIGMTHSATGTRGQNVYKTSSTNLLKL